MEAQVTSIHCDMAKKSSSLDHLSVVMRVREEGDTTTYLDVIHSGCG
ncbi:Uncharacterised protein [Vibrio cholerae]|nr:Uncharacterised protein [Vibrio cholerae]CSI58171.1 Uncharacterised protein [Vibrio cholerae]